MDAQVVPDWGARGGALLAPGSEAPEEMGPAPRAAKRKQPEPPQKTFDAVVVPGVKKSAGGVVQPFAFLAAPASESGVGAAVDQTVPGEAPLVLAVAGAGVGGEESSPALSASYDHPDNEVRKRPRWETPRRRGDWPEAWACAKQLGVAPTAAAVANITCAAVRDVIARVIVMNVGLAKPTVDKWLQLLTEFIEMNVDEHITLLCLLQKYLDCGNSLRSDDQFQRPQKWECVVGISCYFSVMLSEEFAGRTAADLRDLLGGNFKFGREQLSFLKAVDWHINIDSERFASARRLMVEYAQSNGVSNKKVMSWLGLSLMDFVMLQKAHAAVTAAPAAYPGTGAGAGVVPL